MPSLMYYMARHTVSGKLGWGPKYTVTVLKHQADKGLQQVSNQGVIVLIISCSIHTGVKPAGQQGCANGGANVSGVGRVIAGTG